MKLNNREISNKFRVYHRYLGFFLAGIMAMYAISGTLMIFRNTSFLKSEQIVERTIEPGLSGEDIGKALRMRTGVKSVEGDMVTLFNGTYNKATGEAVITEQHLPAILEKFEHIHKATTDSPLFYLNIFFGTSLLFFVISSFWMFLPSTSIFKKGVYFSLGGILLVLILMFV